MTADEARPVPGLEDLLSSAVERQVSEQRELQQVLSGIREAVDALRSEAATPREAADPALRERLDELPGALYQGVREALAPQFAVPQALERTLAELRDRLAATPAEADGLEAAAVEEIGGLVRTASQDVQALAQAMLDLNAGLREWAGEIEQRVGSLGRTLVEGLHDLAVAQEEALGSLGGAVTSSTAELRKDLRGVVRDTARTLGDRLDGVDERLVEAGDLSRYLRDQTEDLDRVLSGLGEVPQRLEGVVAQALRRALTIRAGLVREAEKTLERVLSPVEEKLDRLVTSLETVAESMEPGRFDEELQTLSGGHDDIRQDVEERIGGLEEAILARLERLEEDSARRDRVIAEALDRAAEGLEPGAAEAIEPEPPAKRPRGSSQGKGKTQTKAKSKKKAAPSKGKRSSGAKAASSASKKRSSKKKGTAAKRSSRSKSTKSSSAKAQEDTSASGGSGRRSRRTTTRTRNFIPV